MKPFRFEILVLIAAASFYGAMVDHFFTDLWRFIVDIPPAIVLTILSYITVDDLWGKWKDRRWMRGK